MSAIALHQSEHFSDAERNADAAIVCFPSFHVIWAILSAIALGGTWRFLRIPSALFATLVIASTMSTGWHYATDVLGGLIIAAVSLLLAKWLQSKLQTTKAYEPPPIELMTMEKARLTVTECASVAVIVKAEVPGVVGAPEMMPVAGSSASPAGSVPVVTA